LVRSTVVALGIVKPPARCDRLGWTCQDRHAWFCPLAGAATCPRALSVEDLMLSGDRPSAQPRSLVPVWRAVDPGPERDPQLKLDSF
jgi:hypothetical protein